VREREREGYAHCWEYLESVRMMRVFELSGTVSKTRAMAWVTLVHTLCQGPEALLKAYD